MAALEKAHVQQQRPSTAKNKNKSINFKKNFKEETCTTEAACKCLKKPEVLTACLFTARVLGGSCVFLSA